MKNKQQKPQPIDRHTYLSNSIHKTKVFQMALDNLIDDLLQADENDERLLVTNVIEVQEYSAAMNLVIKKLQLELF